MAITMWMQVYLAFRAAALNLYAKLPLWYTTMAAKTHTLFVNQTHTKPLCMISSPKFALFQVLARTPKRKNPPRPPHVFCQEEFDSVSGVVKIE
jgi:hypothetical protein